MKTKRGRPPAHTGAVRVQFGCKVAPETDAQIRAEVLESGRSAGQVIDRWAEVVRPAPTLPHEEIFGWEFWSTAHLIYEDAEGRTFAKDGYLCWCPPGSEPGDADTEVRLDNGET